jgi:hypothetical protein
MKAGHRRQENGKNYPENITGGTLDIGSPTTLAPHNTLAAIGVKRIFSEFKKRRSDGLL